MASSQVEGFGQESNAVLVLFVSIVSLLSLYYVIYRSRKRNYPPSYGWIPYIGCAVEFGKSPLHFIHWATQRYGSIFTLKVAGKRLTFLTDPEDYKHFFHSPNVDFQVAVKDPVRRTGNISEAAFWKHHTKLHDTVKHRLAPALLGPFCRKLCDKFKHEISSWVNIGEENLNSLVRSSMYRSVLDNLFGDNVIPTVDEVKFREFEKHFVKFDEDFEYGSQLPEIFIKDWSRSKWWLLNLFRQTLAKNDEKYAAGRMEEETFFETLARKIDKSSAPNFSMLMTWASLANAIPITFWSLVFIFSKPIILQKLKKEVHNAVGDQDFDSLEITEPLLNKMPGIKRAVLEAIRMRSPGVITRGVKTTFKINNFTIPAGDHLMLSPYWSHRNTKYFPDPEAYNPDRWLAADLDKNAFLEGFVAFGGGRYQCPGRWFALLEIYLFVALAVHLVDLSLLDPVPTNSPLHLVGVQQPDGPCRVKVTRAYMC